MKPLCLPTTLACEHQSYTRWILAWLHRVLAGLLKLHKTLALEFGYTRFCNYMWSIC